MPFKKIITEDYWPAGLDAAKGANTKDGRFYWATDTGILYRDNGVDAWEPVGVAPDLTNYALVDGSKDFTGLVTAQAGITLTGTNGNDLTMAEQASIPGTPSTGFVNVYPKADGRLYLKDDTGAEFNLTTGDAAQVDATQALADAATAQAAADANTSAVALLANSHLSGAGPPGVGTGDGYPVGSVYADTTANEGYVLTDNSAGANVWSTATGSGSGASFAAITGVPEDNANISAFGASLIDDADAAAARTTLDAARAMLSGAGAPGVATGDGYPVGTVYADTTADEGYVLTDNSAGANVWSSATGTGGGGGSISVLDDAFEITAAVESFDFAGAGLTLTEPTANNVKLTVNGGEEVGGVLGAWKFSTADNAATDPGFGWFKANNTDTTLITEFYFSNGTAAGLTLPMDEVFALGSKIVIQSMSDYSDAAYCEVTLFEAEPVVSEDWCRVTVTVLSSSGAGTWINNRRHGVARLTETGAGGGAVTLGAAATTFDVTHTFMTITGDGGGNTIATITGAKPGQILTLLFVDALVTITDTDAHTADTIDLSAAFTSADDTVLQLVYNGTSWYEVSRSVN